MKKRNLGGTLLLVLFALLAFTLPALAADLTLPGWLQGPAGGESAPRAAAVMLGSTETTFSTIAVYFGAVGITKTRYAVPAALCADLTGFLAAAWAVRVCFG